MASSKDYLNFILEQLSELDGITYRAMMGEFIIYYQNKIIRGVYDDRLLVKDVRSARELMPDAPLELPYDGAKKMILVTEVDDKDFLNNLITSVYEELPAKKKKYCKKPVRVFPRAYFYLFTKYSSYHTRNV